MTPDRSAGRLFIVDFDVVRFSGHYFNQVFGFREAARARGMEPHVFIPKAAEAKVAAALDARAMLPAVPPERDRDALLESISSAHWILRSLWDALAVEHVCARDVLLITSSRPPVIYGLGSWLDALPPQARPAVFIRFFAQEFLDFHGMDFRENAWADRFAARHLSSLQGADRVFFTINDRARLADLERLSARQAFFMPVPKHYGDFADAEPGSSPDVATIYVHANRMGAMPRRINDVARAVLRDRDDVRFLVRFCKHSDVRATAHQSIDEDLIGTGLDLLPAEDDLAAYLTAIGRAQIVLLPYDPIEYRAIVSGVFCEAVAQGKIVVVPGRTWMADQIAEGRAAGVLFEEPTADHMSDAVAHAMGDLSRLQSEASRSARAFREENSCLANLDLMLALAGQTHDMRLSEVPRTHFTEVLGSRSYLGEGWSNTEAGTGVWTEDATAEMVFRFKPNGQPLVLAAQLRPFIAEPHPTLRVEILANGREIGEWLFSVTQPADLGWTMREATIPADIAASGTVTVTLRLDRPASPREFGLSDDARQLGVMLRTLSLTPAGGRDKGEPPLS